MDMPLRQRSNTVPSPTRPQFETGRRASATVALPVIYPDDTQSKKDRKAATINKVFYGLATQGLGDGVDGADEKKEEQVKFFYEDGRYGPIAMDDLKALAKDVNKSIFVGTSDTRSATRPGLNWKPYQYILATGTTVAVIASLVLYLIFK